MDRPLRIVTLNVLAPELLFFYWRSSYGLPLLPTEAAYHAVTLSRCATMARALRALSPDVLLLQEVTDYRHAALDYFPTAEWFARALGLRVASASFKGTPASWGAPPYEQRREAAAQEAAERGEALPRSGGPGVLRADSGVATLFNPAVLRHAGCLGTAEAHGPSAVFAKGWGSAWALDAFSRVAEGGGGGGGGGHALPPPLLRVLNVHMRMSFPRILLPLGEAFERAGRSLGASPALAPWNHVVCGGDFNAGQREAAADFAAYFSPLGGAAGAQLAEAPLPPGGGPPLDRFLVGPGVEVVGGGVVVGDEPLLAMNTQPRGVKVADPLTWGRRDAQYAVHAGNAALVEGGAAGSDHPALLLLVALRPLEEGRRGGGSGGAGFAPGSPRGSPVPPAEEAPAAAAPSLIGPRGAKVELPPA